MQKSAHPFFYEIVPSPLGNVGVVWTGKHRASSVVDIFLPEDGTEMTDTVHHKYPHVDRVSNPAIEAICDQIGAFLRGHHVEFSLECLDMERCYDFQRRVLIKAFEIPCGNVTSYGGLADRIHAPRAARAAGTALARNPFPIILPCHRVIKSTGHLGNFGGGVAMKRALLQLEGVDIGPRGKVDATYFW